MAKKTLIFISILILFSIMLVPPVGAKNMRYYTIDELIKLSDEKSAKRDALCHEDLLCEADFYMGIMMDDGPGVIATEMFEDFRFMITRINPEKETIYVLYHDESGIMRRFGSINRGEMQNFSLSWQDENGVSHPLLTQNDIVPNQEVKIKIEGNKLSSNSSGRIYYDVTTENWHANNYYDYSNCLHSPGYQPGMDCRYVFYEDGDRAYLPFPPDPDPEPEAPETLESLEEPAPISSQAPENPMPTPTPQISTSAMRVPTTPVGTASNPTTADPNDYVEVPLAAGNETAEKPWEFPWWVVIFTISGLFLGFWWLIPIPKRDDDDEKQKNLQKNP